MSLRRTPLVPGEWYHCYTRGVEKRITFETAADYSRFIEALYLCNSVQHINRGDFKNLTHEEILSLPRTEPLVTIGAYCIMPNHFHLLLKETMDGGISKFMHRVGTSYSMYFNIKRKRVGSLFIKPFRSKHIVDDSYLRKIVPYIHLNPVELFEPGWKKGKVRDTSGIERKLCSYRYSSLLDYGNESRIEKAVLDSEEIHSLLRGAMPSLTKILPEAAAYYRELNF